MGNAWKRMGSGKYIDLNNFTKEDVSVKDISSSLNNIIRFDGHYGEVAPLTVAQHTLLCLNLAKEQFPYDYELQMAVLVHDWSEAYYGDIATPIKDILGDKLTEFTNGIDSKVFEAVSDEFFDYSDLMKEIVKFFDLTALDIERRVMWRGDTDDNKWPFVPEYFTRDQMLDRFFECSFKPINLEKLYDDLVEKLRA